MTRLLARTPKSAQLYQRAARTLPFGVVSSFQKMQPYPIYVTHGKGSHIWDQDGTEYLDFHCGFGAMVVGHAHPRIVEAIHEAASRRNPLRGHHRVGGRLRRGDLPAVQPGDAAVRQLGHRGHDGRHPRGAGGDRAGCGLQDRGLVSRPPRQRDVLDRPQRRPHGRPRPAGQRAGVEGHGQGRGQVHRGRAVQRRRPPRAGAPGAGPRDRLPHHGARHDEHRHRGAAARVPPAGARAVHQARRRVHLRRDQDRLHDRRRRRHRALRRAAGPGLPRQGHLRRAAGRRLRRARGPDAAHRAWRVADGDLQRQPAGLPRRAGHAHRGADAGRLSPLRRASAPGSPAAARPPSTATACRPTPWTSAPRAASPTGPPR